MFPWELWGSPLWWLTPIAPAWARVRPHLRKCTRCCLCLLADVSSQPSALAASCSASSPSWTHPSGTGSPINPSFTKIQLLQKSIFSARNTDPCFQRNFGFPIHREPLPTELVAFPLFLFNSMTRESEKAALPKDSQTPQDSQIKKRSLWGLKIALVFYKNYLILS